MPLARRVPFPAARKDSLSFDPFSDLQLPIPCLRYYKWGFNLIEDDKTVNAWCMPGGKVTVYTGLLAQFGAIGLSVALAVNPGVTSDIFMQAYGVGAQVGFLLPYSRIQESQADHVGLILMAKAGYDPRGAVVQWQRMNAKGGVRPPEFLSTHPAPESRIRNIESLIPEAMQVYKAR